MRYALRRILWIVPTLAMLSVVAFWGLTRALGPPVPELGSVEGVDVQARLEKLPRFFNPAPRDVRELALLALKAVAAGSSDAPEARAELARLGGAAMPHVLPMLDSLPPEGRARVALALAPVARRMGVGSAAELDEAGAAVVFWTRYWQDHAIDFRSAVVRRLVRRGAERSFTLRDEDVLTLDTYALAELVEALAVPANATDIPRTRRLSALAAHVTGLPWTLRGDASVDEARVLAHRWKSFWALYGSDYVSFDGPGRAAATITETQYGKWAAEAARSRLGTMRGGRPVLDVLVERSPLTAFLVACGLCGGYALGILLGLITAGIAKNPWRACNRRETLRGRAFDGLTSAAAVTAIALPSTLIAYALAPDGSDSPRGVLAALVMVVLSAALVSRHQRAAASMALEQDYSRTAMALGMSPLKAAWRVFRPSSTPALSLAGVDLPELISAAFVVEVLFGLPGLGEATLQAITGRDVAWLMALTILVALAVALLQVASDLLLIALDPRVGLALSRKRGAIE